MTDLYNYLNQSITERLVQFFHVDHGMAGWWMVRRSPAACIVMKDQDGGCIDGY